jgi:hypothetical protein
MGDVDLTSQLAEQLDRHWRTQLRPRLVGLTTRSTGGNLRRDGRRLAAVSSLAGPGSSLSGGYSPVCAR